MAGKPEFEWWRQLTPSRRAKHQNLIKILNLTPFLYSQICQPDNWIRYAHQVGLLPSESINVKNSDSVDEQLFEKICLVEECNDLVAAEMTKKKYLERVETLLQTVTVDTPVDEVVSQANSNSVIKHWRDKISYKQPSTVNVALLFVCWQHIDHVLEYGKSDKDPEKKFNDLCDLSDDKVLKEKMKGNSEFQREKYRSALSSYTNGLYRSLYNYILYGNRAQAYIKLGKFWEAMCDGYRCVILKPDWPKGQYRYAEAWYKLGDLEKAISVVQTAVELNPNDRDLMSQKARFIAERQKRKWQSKSSSTASKRHEIKTDSGPRVVDKETQSNTPDSDSDDLPDLTSSDEDDTDDSHDTDSDTTNNLPVSQTRRTKTQEKTKTDRLYTTPRNIERLLQHGSEALLQHQPAKALQEYTQAQTVIGKLKHWSDLMKELDYIVLLYAVATAHIDMHTFKHVQEGLTKYKSILKTHEKVPFPLVYLGLGRAYHRQNRFTQALVPLRKGLVENRKQGTLNWPGTKTMIAESRSLLLKVAMEELMDLCKYPPPPIAICKYKECSSNHYKVEIYESDLDFKGYVVMHCFDHCTVAYHTDCWKDIKGKLRTSDKCFTPDCGADIKEILSYDEDCTPHKKVNDRCVTVPKEKKKMVKMKLSSQRKIARKMEKLAMRRQRKQEAREERENPVVTEDKTVKDNREMESKSADLVHPQTAVSASGDGANTSNGPKAIVAVLHHGPGGDGGDEADLFVGSKTTHKPKNKRKKGGFKTSKVTMSLGEFRGDTNEDDVSETDYGLMGLDDFDDCNYGYAPEVPNGYIDTPSTETTITKDTLFSIFANLLHNHGPLHITDPTLQEDWQVFPEQVHHLIEGAGGLRQFLLQSPEFSIVEDVVSLANTDTTSQEPVGTYLKNNFEPPLSAGNVAHMEGVLSNGSVSRLKQNYDTESVSSEGSFASLPNAPRTSTAQLAPIQLDEKSMIHCDSKDNITYIDQKMLRGNIEKASGLSEYSPPCFLEESAPPMPWYSVGTSEYSDLDDNVPERFDDPKRPHDPERFDDPERVDDPEEELSPDEYEFLMRNRQFVPATNNTTTNGGCDTDLKQTVPSESVASLATFSDYERGPSLPRQQPPFHGNHNYNGQYPQPVNIIGHNHVTSTITDFSYTHQSPVPVVPSTMTDFPYAHQSPVPVVPSTMTDFPYAHQSPVPVVPSTMTDFPYTHQSPVPVVPSTMTDFPYTHQSPVHVVTAADKAYILELEEKQEELKVIIMQEQDKYMQFQHETDERINAMQMDSAKSLSISDERINSLCREYAQLKESSNAQIGSLFTVVENLKGEIQEHRRVAAEFEAVSASWQEENTSLSNDIQALNSQLQNVKLKEDRLAADILEKDKKLVSLTKDLTRERDLRALKESEMSEVETKLATTLSRAQSSEVELLQLKLDVGMQILSRSENDATIYSNMFTKQAKEVEGKNPAVSSQFLEAGAEWYKTAARLKSMKTETERNFKDQIVKVEGGQPLSDLPKLPLPKPPQPPKTPVLPVMMKPETPMKQVTPPRTTEAQPSQMGAQAQVSAAAPPRGATEPSAINKVHAVTPQSRPTQPPQHPVPQARGPQPPRQQPVVRPPRPSSSLDKIMLSLHSVYPTFTKQQFKYYIDELRSQRHGSLTGMKLEDIVSSVATIIQGNNPDIGGNRTSPLDTFTLAPASRSDTSSPSSVGCIYEEEEDPCIICHDELETGPVFKLGCSHRFHKKCIDQWLQRHNTCPTCRELIALKAARRW